jgi:hypothetical protein
MLAWAIEMWKTLQADLPGFPHFNSLYYDNEVLAAQI